MAVYEVAARVDYAGPGSPGYNVWHIRTTEPWTITNPEPLDQALLSLIGFYDAVNGSYPTTATIKVPYTVTRIDLTPPELVPYPVGQLPGQSPGELPERLAGLLKLQTAQPGRSGRGRKYLGPLATGCLENNGTMDETIRNAWQVGLNALVNTSTQANDWAIAIWSRLHGEAYDVVAGTVDNEFAQLSSRRF